jgi:hypothetical protein
MGRESCCLPSAIGCITHSIISIQSITRAPIAPDMKRHQNSLKLLRCWYLNLKVIRGKMLPMRRFCSKYLWIYIIACYPSKIYRRGPPRPRRIIMIHDEVLRFNQITQFKCGNTNPSNKSLPYPPFNRPPERCTAGGRPVKGAWS